MGVRLGGQVSYGGLGCLKRARCEIVSSVPEGWETAKEGYECHERDEEHQKCNGREGAHGVGCVGSSRDVTRIIVRV